MRVRRGAPPAMTQPTLGGCCRRRWLARAYSTILSTFGDDFMYNRELPLPLAELYDSNAPGHGLIGLLKMAMWQVRACAHAVAPAWRSCIVRVFTLCSYHAWSCLPAWQRLMLLRRS